MLDTVIRGVPEIGKLMKYLQYCDNSLFSRHDVGHDRPMWLSHQRAYAVVSRHIPEHNSVIGGGDKQLPSRGA